MFHFFQGRKVIIAGPSNVTIAIGNDVDLECWVSHHLIKNITLKWFKNDAVLNMTSMYSLDQNNTLKIHKVTHGSGVAGKYECVVENGSVIVERSQPAWVQIECKEL